MKKIVIIFILAIGFISCSADGQNEITNSDLTGKWNWVSTDGGIAANIHKTPASTGNTLQLSLMKNYTYSITQNGNEVTTGKYELVFKKSIYSGEMERFIQCTETENVQSKSIVINGIIKVYETNNMSISDNNPDGIGSKFVKDE
ncbi:hypothetical protein [Flavobacterium piscis]|uniref:Lipocalin-like domain-containing protein n=1 Tax=Flavobacterium piscis TaxID=1114874 RepID=A0ABU1Y5B5_9FLAO|nr:hypothetical protein [Flavobacterium piscis]MDR7209408.1 hypothetical protein [Flavobacterium piscis]